MKQSYNHLTLLILLSGTFMILLSSCFLFKPCDCPPHGGFSSEKNEEQKQPVEFYTRMTNEFTATM